MRHLGDRQLQRLLIGPAASVREAMQSIDEGSVEIALIVDDDGRLLGTVSDGDVRRALLGGASLADPVEPFSERHPTTVEPGAGRAVALDLMRARRIAQVPEVDTQGRLLGLHLLHEMIGGEEMPNWALILAGGRGTRLGDLTRDTPKPMLKVAGRPIIERMVLHLVGSGVRRIFISVGYLADQIERHFGDGTSFGCRIDYLRESPDEPLGTGGPLRRLADVDGGVQEPILVANGDLVTSFSVSAILGAHEAAEAAMTVGIREYAHDVPFGVVRFADERRGILGSLVEKPRFSWAVNAGVYVVAPHLIERVPNRRAFPITELAQDCLSRDETLLGWRIAGDWQDIGRPDELALARGEV